MFGTIKNSQNERLDYTFHPGAEGARNLVILGHGVTGNKDRPFVVALAEALAARGIAALRFSFSGNGDSEGNFVDSTISKETSDLGAVLDATRDFKVCYVGHSMCGAVGVMRAASDDRIQWLVSLAGMVHTRAFAEREFGTVKPGEGCMWDEPSCPLSVAYMDDAAKIDSVAGLASKISVPWLLIHGSEDDVVPVQDSLDILEKAGETARLIQIPGSNHVFAGEFTAPMVAHAVEWIVDQVG
jgi:uncharacterized protein